MVVRYVSKTVEHIVQENKASAANRFEVHIRIGKTLHFVSRHATTGEAHDKAKRLQASGKQAVKHDSSEQGAGKRKERIWSGKDKQGLTYDQAVEAQALRTHTKKEYVWVVEPFPGKVARYLVVGYK